MGWHEVEWLIPPRGTDSVAALRHALAWEMSTEELRLP